MAKLVSLSRARKDKARAEKRRQANENAVKFGRTRAEKRGETARLEAEAARLDAHRRDEE
jgi:hypothetical protein